MIRRGDIYYADLSPVVGSEQGGIRPVLVIQNNVGNRHSPTVICAAITSKMNKAKLPTHIEISTRDYKIVKNSVILLEQIRTSGSAWSFLHSRMPAAVHCMSDFALYSCFAICFTEVYRALRICFTADACFTGDEKSDRIVRQNVRKVQIEEENPEYVRTFKICQYQT